MLTGGCGLLREDCGGDVGEVLDDPFVFKICYCCHKSEASEPLDIAMVAQGFLVVDCVVCGGAGV